MVKSIVEAELREQAGSNSYNRFEYQVHWIVYHMIQEFEKKSDFYIFCEFHDDMAKTKLIDMPECAEFFQIKTTERFKEWTIKNLFRTYKKPSGGFKNSFLGFLFHNFLKFEGECSKCHFVSNIGMDQNVRSWQAAIEDGKELKKENPKLYEELKSFMKKEYEYLGEKEFNLIFEKFVQNTFLYDGELHLHNYEKVVAGTFLKMLENDDISTASTNKILRDIIEDVRKKSKKKIQTPISYESLKQHKGVSSEVFSKIKDQVKTIESSEKKYLELTDFLIDNGFKQIRIKILLRELKAHKRKLLDISNSFYINSTTRLMDLIDESLLKHYRNIENIPFVMNTVLNEVLEVFKTVTNDEDLGINQVLVEAIFYERINE